MLQPYVCLTVFAGWYQSDADFNFYVDIEMQRISLTFFQSEMLICSFRENQNAKCYNCYLVGKASVFCFCDFVVRKLIS